MDKYHQASRDAWADAQAVTGLTDREIGQKAGWVFKNGVFQGRTTQMAWFVKKGMNFPSLLSLLKIADNGGKRFVELYLQGLTFLGTGDAPEAETESAE